jgi:hypothetical protein
MPFSCEPKVHLYLNEYLESGPDAGVEKNCQVLKTLHQV